MDRYDILYFTSVVLVAVMNVTTAPSQTSNVWLYMDFTGAVTPRRRSMANDRKKLAEENKRLLKELEKTKGLLGVSCSLHIHGAYARS